MSANQIYAKEYEDYLITGDESSLNSLINGSIEKDYFFLIKRIFNEKYTQELEEEIEKFIKKIPREKSIRLRALDLFKQINEFPEKNYEIIEKIKQIFGIENLMFNSKIINEANTSNSKIIKSDEDENSLEYKNIDTHLNLSNYNISSKFNQFINDIYSNKIDPNNKEYKKIFGEKTFYLSLDFNKIPENIIVKIFTTKDDYNNVSFNSIAFMNINYINKILKLIVDDYSKNEEVMSIFKEKINNNYECFTYEQLEAIYEFKNYFDCDNIFKEMIIRKLYNYKKDDKKEEIKALTEIKLLLYKNNYQNDFSTKTLLLILLKLNSDLNFYNWDLFIDYISCPLYENNEIYYLTEKAKSLINESKNNSFGFVEEYPNVIENEQDIIEKHLRYYILQDKNNINKFDKYFNKTYLNKFYAKTYFYKGTEEPEILNMLSQEELNNLINETILKLRNNENKDIFKLDEEIEILLEIKNIKNLYLKIYEINTENYYYTMRKEVDEAVPLDGIIPFFEKNFFITNKPQLLIKKKLKIKYLPKKRGLYIIELIGNKHVSRAVIQRGFLQYSYKDTPYGQVVYILDEKKNICKGRNTGIWVNNIWFKSNFKTGTILIPFNISGDKIIKHIDFCCYTKIDNIEENYDLRGFFIYTNESFIVGNKVKILVRPYLYHNDKICSLNELKKAKIIILSTKKENENEIPSNIIINNVKLSYDNEYCFEYVIPPKLKSLVFKLIGEVEIKSRDEIKELSIEKEIYFGNNDLNYLIKQNDKGNYIINIVGKSGNLLKKKYIDLICHHKYLNSFSDKKIKLRSDSKGEIKLALPDIKSIKINKNNVYIIDNNNNEKYSYEEDMYICENEDIILPLYEVPKDKNRSYFYLIKINSKNQKIENVSDKLKVNITDQKHNLGNIVISKLVEGRYELIIYNTSIIINVSKEGKKNEKKNKINLAIENMNYENGILKIKLNKNNKSDDHPRVHIDFIHYRPNFKNLKDFIEEVNLSDYEKIKSCQKNNIYLNNKILSDEMQYILDRKEYEAKLGNSLEKPSLLMKPQFIRETQTEIIEGEEGLDFEEDYEKNKMSKSKDKKKKSKDRKRKGKNNSYSDSSGTSQTKQNKKKLFNFISVPPIIKENLIPNENGEIIIEVPNLNEYSFAHILCLDNYSFKDEILYLKNGATSLRDLRAQNDLELQKNYCEMRKIYFLPNAKGENTHYIKDINNVKYNVINSLEKYIDFVITEKPGLKNQIKEYEFLLNFGKLNLEEKLAKITYYFSHEINIYLYFHHYDFFSKYIYPILKYKSEKTFIDYFLLNDTQKIKFFYKSVNIKTLNIFEKCLLIYAIRKENKLLASSLSRKIRAECPIIDEIRFKYLFDIALNKIDIKKDEEEEEEEEEDEDDDDDEDENDDEENDYEDEDEDEDANYKKEKKSKSKSKDKKKKNIKAEFEEELSYDDKKGDKEESFRPPKLNRNYLEKEAKRIIAQTKLYNEGGKSKEYCETQYYNIIYKEKENPNIIKPNHFFADLAQFWSENLDSERNIGFKSENFLIIPNSITELIFILAVLDLEEKKSPQNINLIKDKGLGLTIETKSNTYILTKEIGETTLDLSNKYSLIVAQIIQIDGKEDEKEIEKYFTEQIYNMKTVITNISMDKVVCEVLIPLPEGSLPFKSDEYKYISTITIKPYKSFIIDNKFYFPEEGTFKQYPASVSINNLVIAKSKARTYEVISEKNIPKEELTKIEDLFNKGTQDDIINFIQKKGSIEDEDIEKIMFMLDDFNFYNKIINVLKQSYIFNEDIWKYSLKYLDLENMKEYLLYLGEKNILSSMGHEIDLNFIKIDKTSNAHILNHLDYYPMFNSRIFLSQKEKSILNVQLRETYHNYISFLITLPKISDREYMRLCYYLILQKRIKEATQVFNKINYDNIKGNNLFSLSLQYDYMQAYLDFSDKNSNFQKAREICKKYKNFVIKSWANMFKEIEDQLNEYDGNVDYGQLISDEEKNINKQKAQDEIFLSLEIKNLDINILYKNASELILKFYIIDIEIIFSKFPFIKETNIDFDLVKPNKIINLKVENIKSKKEELKSIPIPDELKKTNFYLEVTSGNKRVYDIYYSSSLNYSLVESNGEIKVMDEKFNSLPKIYVKCYCETNSGNILFYKDGFTDLRGKFNYLQLNNDLVNDIKRFSILILSKDNGSRIVICEPPKITKA